MGECSRNSRRKEGFLITPHRRLGEGLHSAMDDSPFEAALLDFNYILQYQWLNLVECDLLHGFLWYQKDTSRAVCVASSSLGCEGCFLTNWSIRTGWS